MASLLFVGSGFLFLHTWEIVSPPALLQSLAATGIVLVASYRLGRRVFNGTLEECIGGGLLILSVAPLALGILGAFSRPLFGAIVVGAALFGKSDNHELQGIGKRLRENIQSASGFALAMGCIGVMAIAWALAGSLAPPAGMDTLSYHLGLPVQFFARGTIAAPDETIYYQSTQAGEMIAALTLAFDSSGIGTNIFLGLFLPLSALLAARTAGELASHSDGDPITARWVAFAAIATMPMAAILVSHTKPDNLNFFLFLLGLRRLALLRSHSLAAFFLGGSLAVKLTSVYGAVPAMIYTTWLHRKTPARIVRIWAIFLCLPGYWLVRNLFSTGHLLPQASHLALWAAGWPEPTIIARIARIVASAFLFLGNDIEGPFGPLVACLLLASLAALFFLQGPLRLCAAVSFSAFLIWFFSGAGSHPYATGGMIRFLWSSLGGGIVAGSVIVSKVDRNRVGKLLRAGLVLASVVCLLTSVRILERYQRFLPLLAGSFSVDEYMKPWLSTWQLQRSAARILPEEAVVLSIGEPRLFYLNREARFDMYGDLPRIYDVIHRSNHDTEALRNWLKEERFTHILDAPNVHFTTVVTGLSPDLPCDRDREFLKGFLRDETIRVLADAENDAYLYEVMRR